MILFSVDADDVGDCAKAATLSVPVAIAAAIVRIFRDMRFSFPPPSKEVLDTACVRVPRQALELFRVIVWIVDQLRKSWVLDTCPSVSIHIQNANGANVGVDMNSVPADPYRLWFDPPVRIPTNRNGDMTRRLISQIACPDLAPSRSDMYVKARDPGDRSPNLDQRSTSEARGPQKTDCGIVPASSTWPDVGYQQAGGHGCGPNTCEQTMLGFRGVSQ